jgi:hypothetical protein
MAYIESVLTGYERHMMPHRSWSPTASAWRWGGEHELEFLQNCFDELGRRMPLDK